MDFEISDDFLQSRIEHVQAYIEDDADPATLELYADPRPGVKGDPGANLIAIVELATPVGTIDAGTKQLVLTVPRDGLVLTSGAISWGRFKTASGLWLFDCKASIAGGGGQIIMASLNVYAGGTARLVSGVIG